VAEIKRLNFWFAIAVVWLFLLYNVDRLQEPIDLASFVYPFTAASALWVLATPLPRLSFYWWMVLPLPAYLALKAGLGYPLAGSGLPLTVTEVCAIELTILIARRVALGLAEFREAASHLLIGSTDVMAAPFESGQTEIYRELRRARRYQRPLSLLSIAIGEETAQTARDRLLDELRRENLERYTLGQLGRLLAERTKDSDVLTRRGDHFVALLPETRREAAEEIARRIAAEAAERLGLTLHVGLSSFPDEEVTFEKLLERAETDRRRVEPVFRVDEDAGVASGPRLVVEERRERPERDGEPERARDPQVRSA
jgi:GGDEF domain-containing protein